MNRSISDDIFDIQIRLFRQFQVTRGLSAAEAERIFLDYEVFEYIAICYDEYHVQGDEANLRDIFKYLGNRGWQE